MTVAWDLLPNVWGPGQLLAFSGIDGPTSWAEPFVLSTNESPGCLRLRLPGEADISYTGMPELRWQVILGDLVVAESARGDFTVLFANHHTLLGSVPDGVSMQISGRALSAEPVPVLRAGDSVLWGGQVGGRWFLALQNGITPPDAANLLGADLAELATARARFVQSVPIPEELSDGGVRLLRKAVSVMKLNTHSANGTIGRRWSTPDRWPHKHMWLWDSAFHAFGMCFVDVSVAQDDILAMLEQVTDTGMLPHMVQADAGHSEVTQPPILGWATLAALDAGADLSWAGACAPLIKRYLDWDRENRDRNGNGIPEWYIEGNPLCRCGESGLDNSSVYDHAVLLDAPDFGSFLYNDYVCLAAIYDRLGESERADECRGYARQIGCSIDELLWCDERDFYFHRDFAGTHVPVKAVSGFMPLFAGIPSPQRAARLVAHLSNPCTFGAPGMIPSESLDSGTFCKDMWRGPAWMNLSYLTLLGLRGYGFNDLADRLRENMLSTIGSWYEKTGCLWEYYDSLNCTSPRDLDRKQRLISGKGICPISDYHWTAAITAALLLGE